MLFPGQDKVDRISTLVRSVTPANLGDIFVEVIRIRRDVKDEPAFHLSEIPLKQLREMAAHAPLGWSLFANPIMPTTNLIDNEVLQLIGLEMSLHELGYCFEKLEWAATITSGFSSPTRFYLNSIYYYVTSLFIVDKHKPNHKDLLMGGAIIRVLHPMGLSSLLDPIDTILARHISKENTFRDIVQKRRNWQLVHGDFSPENLEALVIETQMRDPVQQERLAANIWDLFYEILLLDIRITAILTKLNPDIQAIIARYGASH